MRVRRCDESAGVDAAVGPFCLQRDGLDGFVCRAARFLLCFFPGFSSRTNKVSRQVPTLERYGASLARGWLVFVELIDRVCHRHPLASSVVDGDGDSDHELMLSPPWSGRRLVVDCFLTMKQI